MPQYLNAAEKVYSKIHKNRYFMSEPAQDLDLLMREIRKALEGTSLKIVYRSIDFENLILRDERAQIVIDLSIIPKIENKQEFILWLAGFIEKITGAKKQALPPLNYDYELPDYARDDKRDNQGEKIEKYFKQQKIREEMKQKKNSRYFSYRNPLPNLQT